MTEAEQVAGASPGRKILRWINRTDLAHVVIGGALGGFLMPLVRKFLKSEAPFNEAIKTPDFYDAWFLAALLGAISAGVVVYSLSYSENNNRRQVFFISLLAGLTFPGFLSGALDIDKKKEDLQSGISEARVEATLVDSIAVTEEEKEKRAEKSAETLTEALQEVKAGSLDAGDKAIAVGEAKATIDKIAESAILADGDVNEKIAKDVENTVIEAQKQGYNIGGRSTVTGTVLAKLKAQRSAEADRKKELVKTKLENQNKGNRQ